MVVCGLSVVASVVEGHRLSSCGGPVAPRHVGSSQIWGQTGVPYIAR